MKKINTVGLAIALTPIISAGIHITEQISNNFKSSGYDDFLAFMFLLLPIGLTTCVTVITKLRNPNQNFGQNMNPFKYLFVGITIAMIAYTISAPDYKIFGPIFWAIIISANFLILSASIAITNLWLHLRKSL